jgi:AhpD family alkylhydroperoxidase
MPRLAVIDPEQTTGRAKEIFEGPLKGKHLNIFKGMANAPALLDAYLGIGGALKNASLTPAEQEVIQLAVVESASCDYCTAAHTVIGKNSGLTDDHTIGARRGEIQGEAKLDAVAKFAKALYEKRGNVSHDDLTAFRNAGYNDQAIAEAVGVYALATLTSTFNHVNETEVDFPAPPAI